MAERDGQLQTQMKWDYRDRRLDLWEEIAKGCSLRTSGKH